MMMAMTTMTTTTATTMTAMMMTLNLSTTEHRNDCQLKWNLDFGLPVRCQPLNFSSLTVIILMEEHFTF